MNPKLKKSELLALESIIAHMKENNLEALESASASVSVDGVGASVSVLGRTEQPELTVFAPVIGVLANAQNAKKSYSIQELEALRNQA